MKELLFSIFVGLIAVLIYINFEIIITTHDGIQAKMEYGYFEGQKDYAEGDIKIAENEGCYNWTRSPWDNGMAWIYNPIKDCSPKERQGNFKTNTQHDASRNGQKIICNRTASAMR